MKRVVGLVALVFGVQAYSQVVWTSTQGIQVKQPDGTTAGDYWYSYSDPVGSKATVAPASFASTGSANTPLKIIFQLGDSMITPTTGYPYDPYTGAGFGWAAKVGGVAVSYDISAKGAVCLTYSSTASLTMSLNGTTNASYTLPAVTTKTTISIPWASFTPNGATAAAANAQLQWQFQAAPSSADTFSIYTVGLGSTACGATTTISYSSSAVSSSSSVISGATAGVLWVPSDGAQGKEIDGSTPGGYWYSYSDKGSRTACATAPATTCNTAALDTTPSFVTPADLGTGLLASANANSGQFSQVILTTGTALPYLPYSWASYVGFGLNLDNPVAPVNVSRFAGLCVTYSATQAVALSLSSTTSASVTLPATASLTTTQILWNQWDTVAAVAANSILGTAAQPASYPIRVAILGATAVQFQYGGVANTSDTIDIGKLAFCGTSTTAASVAPVATYAENSLQFTSLHADRIQFHSQGKYLVTLEVFNTNGKSLGVIYQGTAQGDIQVPWSSNHLSAGLYLFRLKAGAEIQTTKFVLSR